MKVPRTPGAKSSTPIEVLESGPLLTYYQFIPKEVAWQPIWAFEGNRKPRHPFREIRGHLLFMRKGLVYLCAGTGVPFADIAKIVVGQVTGGIADNLPAAAAIALKAVKASGESLYDKATESSTLSKNIETGLQDPRSFAIPFTDMVEVEHEITGGFLSLNRKERVLITVQDAAGTRQWSVFPTDWTWPAMLMTFRYGFEHGMRMQKLLDDAAGTDALAQQLVTEFRNKHGGEIPPSAMNELQQLFADRMLAALKSRDISFLDLLAQANKTLSHFNGVEAEVARVEASVFSKNYGVWLRDQLPA